MAGESTQVADRNEIAAQRPADSVLPRRIRRSPRNYLNGCACQTSKCRNSNCVCYKNDSPCTSKCKCQGCNNTFGVKVGDTSTGAGQGCKCTFSRCMNKHCHCLKGSQGCTSKCECKDCRNPKGVRGSEPEQADDTSNMAREPPQMGSRGASKRSRNK